jgi:hypothetical protein
MISAEDIASAHRSQETEARDSRAHVLACYDRVGSHATATASSSGIFVRIIFGFAGRVAERSRMARPQAVGVHRMPWNVAGDYPRVLPGGVMLLVWCFV